MTKYIPLLELVILWVSARWVFQGIYEVLTLFGFSRNNSIKILALIFLPGTLLHELSHFLAAEGLGVRAGNFIILPKDEGHGIKMGSVRVEKTDPVRSFFIGIAPLIMGILFLSTIFFGIEYLQSQNLPLKYSLILYTVGGYSLFVIVNMMFSSKKDLEACVEFIGLVAIIFAVLFFWGGDVWIQIQNVLKKEAVEEVLRLLSWILLFPIGINVSVVVISSLMKKVIIRH